MPAVRTRLLSAPAAPSGQRRRLSRANRRALWPEDRAGRRAVPERSRIARGRYRGPDHASDLAHASERVLPRGGLRRPGASDVRGLQRRLRADGSSPGPIDGRYGPLTSNAVRRFQAAHGLNVDGVAGPQTFRELTIVSATARGPARTPDTQTPEDGVAPEAPAGDPTEAPAGDPSEAVAAERAPSRPARRRARGRSCSCWRDWSCLAAFASGAWLIDRRRRGLRQPSLRWNKRRRVEQPEDAKPSLELAARLLEQGDTAGAELAYRDADQRGDPVAASNLGVLLEKRGDIAGAEAAYRRSDARGSANGAFNLAGMLLARGTSDGAIAAYSRADPARRSPARRQTSRCCSWSGRRGGGEGRLPPSR